MDITALLGTTKTRRRDFALFCWYLLRAGGNTNCPLDEALVELQKSNTDERARARIYIKAAELTKASGGFKELTLEQVIQLCQFQLHLMMANASPESFTWYAEAYCCDLGFPTVQVGHKLASSLICTSIGEQVLEDLRLPWPSFCVDIPDNLIHLKNDDGELDQIEQVLVYCIEEPLEKKHDIWGWHALSHTSVSLYSQRYSAKDLYGRTDCEGQQPLVALEYTSVDKRASYAISRLVLNVAIHMTGANRLYKSLGKSHGRYDKTERQEWQAEPLVRQFQLTTKVLHNHRDMVRDYIRGTGKKLNVRSWVSGHVKWQAHGPKMSLRKRIWVESYPRGPKGAPVALRQHVLD